MSRPALRAALLGVALAALSSFVRAELSHAGGRQSVGPPRGAHAMPAVDSLRSRHPASQLAQTPKVERRLRVAYGIGRGLITDDAGNVLVLHASARASRFDAQGTLLYSLKLPSEPRSAPIVTSNGSSAFVAAGALDLIDSGGRFSSHALLGDADFTARSILAAADGGVVVASTAQVVKLSAYGDLVWRKAIAETPLELLETSVGLLCVTVPGSIYRFDDSGRTLKLGDLGAAVQAVTASPEGATLLARTGSHRLVTFDLRERRALVTVEDAALEFDGPVLFGADRSVQAFTADGLLVRYRADGSESQRVPIDPGARKAPSDDDVLALADGRLGIARAGADVVLVTPTGEVASIPGSACPDPVGLFGLGPRAVLLACRSGNLLRLE